MSLWEGKLSPDQSGDRHSGPGSSPQLPAGVWGRSKWSPTHLTSKRHGGFKLPYIMLNQRGKSQPRWLLVYREIFTLLLLHYINLLQNPLLFKVVATWSQWCWRHYLNIYNLNNKSSLSKSNNRANRQLGTCPVTGTYILDMANSV